MKKIELFKKKPKQKTEVEEAIANMADELQYHDPSSEEAKAIVTNIKTLSESEEKLRPKTEGTKQLVGQIIGTVGTVACTLLVCYNEQAKILPRNAMSVITDSIRKIRK